MILSTFAENCMKMKTFWPPGGGARPLRHPLDPPLYMIYKKLENGYSRFPLIQSSLIKLVQLTKFDKTSDA